MRPDRGDPLIAELKKLSDRELRLTLQRLSAPERAQVLALIEAASDSQAPLSFDALAGLSPWLLKAVDEAKSADRGSKLTPAAREAFMKALARLSEARAPAVPADAPSVTFVGRLIARARKRSA